MLAKSLVILILLSATESAYAQMVITHTYPFSQARCVVAEKVDTNPATIFEGAGAGVFVLDGTNLEPQLKSGVANELRAGGMVRDLALTADHLYVAVHRGGISRFTRSATAATPNWITGKLSGIDVSDAWAVNVPVRIGDLDLVFVGTNDEHDPDIGANGGTLYMVSADAVGSFDAPAVEASVSVDAPIFSLASMVSGNTVTLLVGTACRKPTGSPYASLLRYDFDISSGFPTSIPTPTTWNPTVSGSAVATFIRDIVIDPVDDVAYVAAYTRGVFKVDINSNGTLSTASGSRPITAGTNNLSYFSSLALHDGGLGKILVVGKGPEFRTETTEWGECTYFEPCNDSTGTEQFGVALYDVSGSSASSVGSLTRSIPSVTPLSLSTYVRSGKLVITAACQQHGLIVLEATPSSGTFTVEEEGAWDVFGDGIPTGQFDDLVVLGNNVYAAFETGLGVFDITEDGGLPAADLFDSPVDVATGGGPVILAGCAAEMSFPTMIFSANLEGVGLYDVSGDGPTANATYRGLFNPVSGVRTYFVGSVAPSETPDGYPWMVAVNSLDVNNDKSCSHPGGVNSSVRIYRVRLDGTGHPSPSGLLELGAYEPDPCVESSGMLLGIQEVADEDGLKLYVAYGPRQIFFDDEPDAGLLYLEFDFVENTSDPDDDALTLTSSTKVPAFEDALDVEPGSVHYKTSHGIVTAVFGCNGVATFSLSEALLQKWPSSGSCPTSFLDVDAGPEEYLYVTGLDGRLRVFDPTDVDGGPIASFETMDQTALLAPAESTISGSPPPAAFFLTDFRGGLHRIQFQTTP